MQIDVVHQGIADIEADAVIVNLFQGVTRPGGATGAVDQAMEGQISKAIAAGSFKGKLGETLTLYPQKELPFRKVVVVGLGPSQDFDLECVRKASGAAIKEAAKGGAKRVATIVHGAGIGGLDATACAQSVAEGSILATYRFQRFKRAAQKDGNEASSTKNSPQSLVITELDEDKLNKIKAGVAQGTIAAEATSFARDLVNTPPNHMTPTHLAQAAEDMAKKVGLACEVMEQAEMEQLGMGILLGVAQGSEEPPKLITLRHEGAPGEPWLALVGKGVTFDSGGLSLKPAGGMEEMKSDMAGGAAVLGVMRALAQLKAPVNILAVVPSVENMPSGKALRPGDVLEGMAGKSIEVANTDAEGRLILADAVAYAKAQPGVAAVIDVATLTGAVVVALGRVRTGYVTNNEGLAQLLESSASKSGERFWRLPGDTEYRELYKSDVADIKNIGGRQAGTITGALIISEFIDGVPWLHLDIAATAFSGKAGAYNPKGATGVTVRTLIELALDWRGDVVDQGGST